MNQSSSFFKLVGLFPNIQSEVVSFRNGPNDLNSCQMALKLAE